LELLPVAAAVVTKIERAGDRLVIDSPYGAGISWKGPASLDGRPWPAFDGETVWLPAGTHTLAAAPEPNAPRIVRFTGDLRNAQASGPGVIEFSYESSSRAIAILDRAPLTIEVDGNRANPVTAGQHVLLLPRGKHVVTISGAVTKAGE